MKETDATSESQSDPRSRKPYEAPRTTTYSKEEVLAGVGPAIAIYGPTGVAP